MPHRDTPHAGPLQGLCVLVPRGGPWGEDAADRLRHLGAEPLVVPLVAFAPPEDAAPLDAALDRLRRGAYDWLVVTSATTVDALVERGVTTAPGIPVTAVDSAVERDSDNAPGPPVTEVETSVERRPPVPPGTRVAAVGAATRAACERAGMVVALVPEADHSALGLAAALPDDAGHVLLPQSDLADPGLARGLRSRGVDVDAVVAYRTVPAAVDPTVRAAVRRGDVGAVLVTSGSVARQVAVQLGPLPATTLVACLGPRTAADAAAAGLHVDVIAPDRTLPALLAALAAHRP